MSGHTIATRRKIYLGGGFLIVGLLSWFFLRPVAQPVSTPIILVGGEAFKVEIADTDTKRGLGLGNRASIGKNEMMLFSYPQGDTPIFWMKNMRFPIDIIWVRRDAVVGIEKMADPQIGEDDEDLTLYPAPEEIDAVLEVAGGTSDRLRLRVGDTIATSKVIYGTNTTTTNK